ncbi:MAG: transcriptional regulator [Gammaproteobacteria bacterium]|jgi:DNA-binding MarR family transcriptional regulator
MSSAGFDEVIHAPNRLQICAYLDSMAEVEFQVLRDFLDVSDSALSKHLKVLEEAGYLDLTKRTANGRQRTWLALNRQGRNAYHAHVKTLKQIVG